MSMLRTAVLLTLLSLWTPALASDLIWRETVRMEKPIVASLSDVAASGGYYISVGCDKVLAEPGTLARNGIACFFPAERRRATDAAPALPGPGRAHWTNRPRPQRRPRRVRSRWATRAPSSRATATSPTSTRSPTAAASAR